LENPAAPEDLVALLRSGAAPREIRVFAARGLLPLDPDASLRALLGVVEDPDPEIAATARLTLAASSPDRLASFLRSGEPQEREIGILARESDDPFVLEEVVRSRITGDETLLLLARTASGRPQEALIANQARLLSRPALVQALLENPALTDEGRRLLSELTEEFFAKKARRLHSNARRAEEDAIAEGTEEDDLESSEDEEDLEGQGDEAASEDSPEESSEETSEEDSEANSLFIGAIYRRIGLMTISEKIALAYTGSKEERRVLIGDSNKLIGIAVLKSRSLSINEVESFAGMRNMDEEIYRRIAATREWMRKPAVILALVKNPRVPRDVSLPLLKRLATRELRGISRDRNLAPVLRTSARKLLILRRR
jgi:hypothetical protein